MGLSIKGATKAIKKAAAPVQKAVAPVAKAVKKAVTPVQKAAAKAGAYVEKKVTAPIVAQVKAAPQKAGQSIADNAGPLERVLKTGTIGGSLGNAGESIAKAGVDINTAAVKAGKDYVGMFNHLGDPNTYKSPSGFGGPGGGRPQQTVAGNIADILGGGAGGAGGAGGVGGTGGASAPGGRNISMVDNPTFDPRFKNAQTGLLTHLQDRAAGRGGPSLAEMQQKQAGNKAMQNTLGAVRAGTGSNAALAARTAALAGGNQMANLANESAMMRMREQQDAQSQIAGLAAQGRQGGVSEAGLSMDAQRANQASDLSQQGMANEMARADLAARTQIGAETIRANAQPGPAAQPSMWEKLIPIAAGGLATYASGGNPAVGAAAATAAQAGIQSGYEGSVDQAYDKKNSPPAGPTSAGPYQGGDGPMRLTGAPAPIPAPAPVMTLAPAPEPVPAPVLTPAPSTPPKFSMFPGLSKSKKRTW